MKTVPLSAVPRTQVRRKGANLLRSTGRIPAVIYGRHRQSQTLDIAAKELDDLTHHAVSENLLVNLAVQGDTNRRLALVQEVQHHPLSGKVLHVDLHEVAENEMVTIMVPVETTGEAAGVKTDGGVLEHVLFKLKVRALPKDLPEQIVVDVTNLKINQTIHIGEIPVPAGVEILGDKKVPVISVAMPRTEAEETAEAEAAAAAPGEVEMIKEKKEDGETGETPAKGAEKAPAKAAAKGDAKAPAKGDAKAPAAGDKKAAPPGADKKK